MVLQETRRISILLFALIFTEVIGMTLIALTSAFNQNEKMISVSLLLFLSNFLILISVHVPLLIPLFKNFHWRSSLRDPGNQQHQTPQPQQQNGAVRDRHPHRHRQDHHASPFPPVFDDGGGGQNSNPGPPVPSPGAAVGNANPSASVSDDLSEQQQQQQQHQGPAPGVIIANVRAAVIAALPSPSFPFLQSRGHFEHQAEQLQQVEIAFREMLQSRQSNHHVNNQQASTLFTQAVLALRASLEQRRGVEEQLNQDLNTLTSVYFAVLHDTPLPSSILPLSLQQDSPQQQPLPQPANPPSSPRIRTPPPDSPPHASPPNIQDNENNNANADPVINIQILPQDNPEEQPPGQQQQPL